MRIKMPAVRIAQGERNFPQHFFRSVYSMISFVFNQNEKKRNNPVETDPIYFEIKITQTHEILLITSSSLVFVTTFSVNSYFTLKIYQTPFSQFDFSLASFFYSCVRRKHPFLLSFFILLSNCWISF